MEPCNKCKVCNKLCEIVPVMAGKFKALGDLTRLQIIYLLATDTSGTLGVSELAVRLKISQPAVSQHLKTLKGEGLVDSRRVGFYVYYTINRDRIVEFREQFELMYSSVMENCSRELIRKSTRDRSIRACVLFYSYSGVTRGIAEGIHSSSGCDLIEVKTKTEYSNFTAYTTGVLRSRKGACDPIVPEEIDVSQYDLLIIGTPVWAWKPAPAINAAVRALKGCEGKMAVTFVTCNERPGEALPLLTAALAERGVEVMAEICLTKEDTKNPAVGNELLGQISAAFPVRIDDEPRTSTWQKSDVKS
ncbi:metalloregulator ArsR/SmtB family transcription factor [Methanoregula sp.]|uniref:metalloregulator ArsR/SmtB family transcription factor n=1 Tax=Methanoregula sp. TaxID=2052170 RepID=UPI003566D699